MITLVYAEGGAIHDVKGFARFAFLFLQHLHAGPVVRPEAEIVGFIMPGLDGPTWVRQALKQRPNTKVVFVSGYPEDAFEDGQPEIPDAVFLPKPFSLTALTETVHLQLQDASVPVQARSQSLSAAPSATR